MKKLPLSGKLGKGKFTMVDDEDAARLEEMGVSLCTNKRGYVFMTFNRKTCYLHRFITNAPKGLVVDHINHNKMDNRKCNLRICTQSQNLANQRAKKGGASKYKGVVWHKLSNKWAAQIFCNGSNLYLGTFEKETDAALAYNAKAKELFGEFAYLNQI